MLYCIVFILFYMNKIPFRSSVFRVPHFFPIFSLPLGMPIDSEIMDGFWHSRFLNDHIDLFYMIGSLASGANTSLVAKNGTKQPWVKIENLRNFDHNFALFRGKVWLWLSYIFFALWFQNSTHKISSRFDQKWRHDGDFPDFDFILNQNSHFWGGLFYETFGFEAS